MRDVERIREAVYRTIEAVNDLLPSEQALEPTTDLVLLGEDATLDSMGFVNFIVALEEELERELGRDLDMADLLDVRATDAESVSTVADLINLLAVRLRDRRGNAAGQ